MKPYQNSNRLLEIVKVKHRGEHRTIETIQLEEQKDKRMRKKDQSLRNLWDHQVKKYIYNGVLDREEKDIEKKYIVVIFPNLM